MTEPVAYMWKTVQGTITGLAPNDNSHSGGRLGIPLYTAEQLQPRVKMTQTEFDEWNNLDFENNIFGLLSQLLDDVTEPDYPNLTKRIYGTNGDGIEDNYKQIELANLFIDYNPDNPEETIEIVPNMKWFVRSKEKIQGFYMFLGYLNELRDPWIFTKQDNFTSFAQQFDTKEEAEKWTNPLTEAVQLPVEGE